jgi:hypothetical protein
MSPGFGDHVTTTQYRAYSAPMHETTAETAPDISSARDSSPLDEWRALWALEDGQPEWLRESVATIDGAIQGEMGHS